jgi:hypothetical protein
MGVYVNPSDCTDPALRVTEAHCALADTRVNSALWARGIDPAEVAPLLPLPNLTALGVAYACAQAALEGARGEETTLMSKHEAYEAQAKTQINGITRQSLGLELPEGASGGYGSVVIGRG